MCPRGWNLYGDVCLKLMTSQLTFDQAQLTGCSEGYFYSQEHFGFWAQVILFLNL